MKTEYTCSSCLKDFSQKAQYERHLKRKNPCKASNTVKKILQESPVIETVKDSTGSFRQNSVEMNKKLKRDVRKEHGIFFTPKKARDLVYTTLHTLGVKPKKIL